MIVDLRTIEAGTRHFDLTFETDWWRGHGKDDQVLGFDDPLETRISIAKAGNKYVLDVSLSGGLRLRCDRCLESFHSHLESEFRLFLSPSPADTGEGEIELMEDDLSIDFITGDEIDLDDVVREQIYVSLPIKSLCSENCLGMCHICGNNLNNEECKCGKDQGHPGFSKLRNMKLKGV